MDRKMLKNCLACGCHGDHCNIPIHGFCEPASSGLSPPMTLTDSWLLAAGTGARTTRWNFVISLFSFARSPDFPKSTVRSPG